MVMFDFLPRYAAKKQTEKHLSSPLVGNSPTYKAGKRKGNVPQNAPTIQV